MFASVSDLLRNFPKIRRAALAGQRVVIRTREGNLVLTAEKASDGALFGALSDVVQSKNLKASESGASDDDWSPSL